jgi:hypothetical protein
VVSSARDRRSCGDARLRGGAACAVEACVCTDHYRIDEKKPFLPLKLFWTVDRYPIPLHLAIASYPASADSMKVWDLEPLFQPGKEHFLGKGCMLRFCSCAGLGAGTLACGESRRANTGQVGWGPAGPDDEIANAFSSSNGGH